ncbi:hypothetical protein GCM10010384_01190 [Streptomyces djakartensis]|uniref:Cas12f1-like TNB domain-containing protein n=1 Tax=Streptomyces djakartensis TaxID=68193 RepID=A0ABQ2Z2P6_9ACTN|nr:hypothetical protein GCM10010384_01190 [Streptomyces djakartensis]
MLAARSAAASQPAPGRGAAGCRLPRSRRVCGDGFTRCRTLRAKLQRIALEELTGIRERVRLRKPQRATHSSWSFAQLGQFIAYKARRAGVPVVYVDPAYTSRTCAECGYIDRGRGWTRTQHHRQWCPLRKPGALAPGS